VGCTNFAACIELVDLQEDRINNPSRPQLAHSSRSSLVRPSSRSPWSEPVLLDPQARRLAADTELAGARTQVGPCLRPRVSWGEKDTREARRAVAQLVENGGADEAPESVSRDFVEEVAQPAAIKAEIYEPCGDVDEV
jgi:hypothetical protein